MNMQLPKKTGLSKFLWGFRYALSGLSHAFRTQCNIRVHLLIAAIAFAASVALGMTALEVAMVTLAITLVLTAELLNTAIETVVDLVSPDIHPLAKTAKDVAAAAVMVSALGAGIIGLLLFVPALLKAAG